MNRGIAPRFTRALAPLSFALVMVLAGCSSSTSSTSAGSTATPLPTATITPTATTAPTATAVGYPVKVFFSKHPDSDSNPALVFSVNRTAPSLAVATYASQQLFAGPTSTEATAGYFTPWQGVISGASNCGGPDFTITLNMKGSTPETNTATLQFCKSVSVAGEVAGGQMQKELTATLTQFSNIHKAVILTKEGSCFEDLSGMNLCLS